MTLNPIVQAFADRVAEEAPEMQAAWKALDIEWHCQGRHGIVRHVPREDAGRVQRVIDWHMGYNSCRWADEAPRIKAVEFVAMTKTVPAPSKPWEWCGETVLFKDWQDQELTTREQMAQFSEGDKVSFTHNNEKITGWVAKTNKQTVSVLVPNEGRWTVPPAQLNKEN